MQLISLFSYVVAYPRPKTSLFILTTTKNVKKIDNAVASHLRTNWTTRTLCSPEHSSSETQFYDEKWPQHFFTCPAEQLALQNMNIIAQNNFTIHVFSWGSLVKLTRFTRFNRFAILNLEVSNFHKAHYFY